MTEGEEMGMTVGDRYRGVEDINDFCPQCREEFGIVNLLGFGQ